MLLAHVHLSSCWRYVRRLSVEVAGGLPSQRLTDSLRGITTGFVRNLHQRDEQVAVAVRDVVVRDADGVPQRHALRSPLQS